MSHPAPLTVIGGFLGAGKTTLVNHILREADGVRYAVLVNDFGDLAIDEDLITEHNGKTIALANGCICCTIGNDLFETVMDLMESDMPPEHLIIEASGVADPRPIAELGSLNPHLSRDLTVVVIDAEQIEAQWKDERLRDTVARQLEAANLLALNKIENLDPGPLSDLEDWLDCKTGDVPRIKTDRGRIPLAIFGEHSPGRKTSTDPAQQNHDHGLLFETRTLVVNPSLTIEAFRQRAMTLPSSVLRAKGHITLEGDTHLFQKAGPRISLIASSIQTAMKNPNRIVIIGLDDLPSETWFE